MSRARHINRLYLVAGEPELDDPLRREDDRRPVDRTVQSLARSAAQVSATDVLAQARLERMSIPELQERVEQLDREAPASERRTRREHALRERSVRRGEGPIPVPPAPSAETIDERALLRAELDRRQRPRRIAILLDPPPYLIDELGPVPEQLVARGRWRAAAEQIEAIRRRLGFTDHRQALPDRVRNPKLRAEAQALRRGIRDDRGIEQAAVSREVER